MIRIKRNVTSVDAYLLGKNLREADRIELDKCGQTNHMSVVMNSVKSATLCWAGYAGNDIISIGGVSPSGVDDNVGCPWLLSSTCLPSYYTRLLKVTKRFVKEMNNVYPFLFNSTDINNTVSLEWLKWAGFTLGDKVKLQSGATFVYFYRSKEDV